MRPLVSFTPNLRLAKDFGKIAELVDNRKSGADQDNRQRRNNPKICRGSPPGQRRTDYAARKAGPGLPRAPAWRQTRAAQRSANCISADIGRPNHGKNPQEGLPTGRILTRQPQQTDTRKRHPKRAERCPSRTGIGALSRPPEHYRRPGEGSRDGKTCPQQCRSRNRCKNDTDKDNPGLPKVPPSAQSTPLPSHHGGGEPRQQRQPRRAEPNCCNRQRRKNYR